MISALIGQGILDAAGCWGPLGTGIALVSSYERTQQQPSAQVLFNFNFDAAGTDMVCT